MISVLIPVYNFDCCRLVTELHYQCSSIGISFEIRVIDDASIPEFKTKNAPIRSLSNVTYIELPQNIGRSAIRNKLATDANYQHLLFIDCDAEIIDSDFIQKYVALLSHHKIICGGLTYSHLKPQPLYQLRWYYGKKIEAKSAIERKKNEWHSFSFFNTLIEKNIFLSIQCNEIIRKYGHEDTLFGLTLAQQHIPIKHINNPLIHSGLNTNRAFILKTKESIDSLYLLSKTEYGKQIENYSCLLVSIKKISKIHLINIFAYIHRYWGMRLEYLLSIFPKQLLLLQFIKLCYLARLYKQRD